MVYGIRPIFACHVSYYTSKLSKEDISISNKDAEYNLWELIGSLIAIAVFWFQTMLSNNLITQKVFGRNDWIKNNKNSVKVSNDSFYCKIDKKDQYCLRDKMIVLVCTKAKLF